MTKENTEQQSRRYRDAPRIDKLKDSLVYLIASFVIGVPCGGALGVKFGNGHSEEKMKERFIPRIEYMKDNFRYEALLTDIRNDLKHIKQRLDKGTP